MYQETGAFSVLGTFCAARSAAPRVRGALRSSAAQQRGAPPEAGASSRVL